MPPTDVVDATGKGPVLQLCVVCQEGSTRDDWINTVVVNGVTYVACDHHSKDEVAACANEASLEAQAEADKKAQSGTDVVSVKAPTDLPPAPATPPAGTPVVTGSGSATSAPASSSTEATAPATSSSTPAPATPATSSK